MLLVKIASVTEREIRTRRGMQTKYDVTPKDRAENPYETFSPWLASICDRAEKTGRPVILGLRETKWAYEIVSAELQ